MVKSKKDLKKEYLQIQSEMGVFELRNTSNNKVLIDRSTNIQSKWNRHRTELKFGSHRNKQLQADWKQYGEAQFKLSVLSNLEHSDDAQINYKDELIELEKLIREENNFEEY